ncbi:MAG: hypothetical protein V1703_00710 [Candidatus Altiarchaeota archaeon]
MKKRYFGVVHITPEGDGVIELLGEEVKSSSLRQIEQRYKIALPESAPAPGNCL